MDRDGSETAPWKPSLNPGVDIRGLPLTQEEGFVASRLDGATDVQGLSQVTGLPLERLEAVLERLVSVGAVSAPEVPGDGEPAAESEQTGTHRKLYETTLRLLSAEERAARAKTAEEPELSALCFDPLPQVIYALLDNPRFGLPQARLVAAKHHGSAGLEALGSRAAFAADAQVRLALLRNPQLPAAFLRRLYGSRRLVEIYKLVVSRDVPEQTRRAARELMRNRFSSADADERVEAIIKTEGRCLSSLAGVGIDAKTAALLCSRTYTSTLLVQNISRWTPAPPTLIAHLMKQEIVRRSPPLRLLLLRHPNAPKESQG